MSWREVNWKKIFKFLFIGLLVVIIPGSTLLIPLYLFLKNKYSGTTKV